MNLLQRMLFESLEWNDELEKFKKDIFKKKLVTVFEPVESTQGEPGWRLGTKRSCVIYWLSDINKFTLAEEEKSVTRMKDTISKLKYDILAKCKSTSDFCEYLKATGEWDPKRGPMGYDILNHIKIAKSYISDVRYVENVIVPFFKIIMKTVINAK